MKNNLLSKNRLLSYSQNICKQIGSYPPVSSLPPLYVWFWPTLCSHTNLLCRLTVKNVFHLLSLPKTQIVTSCVRSLSHSELNGPTMTSKEAGGDAIGLLDPQGRGHRERQQIISGTEIFHLFFEGKWNILFSGPHRHCLRHCC